VSSQSDVPICLRCGVGFILTSNYRDLLQRRQVNLVVPVLCPTCFVTKGPLPKQHGTVKWFNPAKRFGFITTESGDEAFFHQDQLLGDQQGRLRGGGSVPYTLSDQGAGGAERRVA
jgi:CspA family cold shock protein